MLTPENIPNSTPNTAVAANVLTTIIEIIIIPLAMVERMARFIVPKVCTKAPGMIRPNALPTLRMGTYTPTKIKPQSVQILIKYFAHSIECQLFIDSVHDSVQLDVKRDKESSQK